MAAVYMKVLVFLLLMSVSNCFHIDECKKGTDDCHDNAVCTDSPTGYDCSCSAGYTGNGITCTDIDECQQPDTCEVGFSCINALGTYHCFRDDYAGPR